MNETHPRTKQLAIICLTIIVCVCVFHGIDHALVAITAAIIGGIAGYEIKKTGLTLRK